MSECHMHSDILFFCQFRLSKKHKATTAQIAFNIFIISNMNYPDRAWMEKAKQSLARNMTVAISLKIKSFNHLT